MPVQFRSFDFVLPGGAGSKSVSATTVFDRDVISMATAIQSFTFDYSNGDHHINVVSIRTFAGFPHDSRTVEVSANCEYADENFDDPYTGNIRILLIVEVV